MDRKKQDDIRLGVISSKTRLIYNWKLLTRVLSVAELVIEEKIDRIYFFPQMNFPIWTSSKCKPVFTSEIRIYSTKKVALRKNWKVNDQQISHVPKEWYMYQKNYIFLGTRCHMYQNVYKKSGTRDRCGTWANVSYDVPRFLVRIHLAYQEVGCFGDYIVICTKIKCTLNCTRFYLGF